MYTLMTFIILVLSAVAFLTSLVAIDVSYKTNTPQQCPRLAAGLSVAFFIMAIDSVIHPVVIDMSMGKHLMWYGLGCGSLIMVILFNRAQIMRTRLMISLVKKRKARHANRNSVKDSNACGASQNMG